ncbi:ABC transporter transmembrane domain-containing protein [Acuticoccus sp. MNP-M23]|uniref:ABC transporter transmembrane domain-containing protein n=1 Tax=Acuticoccus sp. MNP-M23 TaxID=3072793 RepID=UPI00281575B5|nr:ABC transporter transmembrane domain-containing protein [Acuticoccus sp. MNP-M23]WMS40967.1 ABC transporter transmembrane domain-containing protein [Acuticoccus sp. MNP-M23]
MLLVTMVLNVFVLAVPLATAQVFDRILSNPHSPTLFFILVSLVAIAVAEAVLRLGRAAMLARSHTVFAAGLAHSVLTHVVQSDIRSIKTSSSRSLEQLNAIQQVAERYSGQVLVSGAELLFLPIVVAGIFAISVKAGMLVAGGLLLFGAITLVLAMRMNRLAGQSQIDERERYEFLFSALSALDAVKSLGVEDNVARRHESIQRKIAAANHALAIATTRLLSAAPLANQAMMMATLVFGAVAVGQGELTMGAVTALVLLSGRVTVPLQRAVFLLVQMKDIVAAREKVGSVLSCPAIATPQADISPDNIGRLSLQGVTYDAEPDCRIADVTLNLKPGEVLCLSSDSERQASALLRLMAGIIAPTSGVVELNGVAPTAYNQPLLNACVGYLPAGGVMFRGSIRENITRFGEVPIEQAMNVAALLGVDTLIKELPDGVETPLTGRNGEAIPPGLIQQLSFVRALAQRPRLILLDRADRGLDRNAYSRLHKFVGALRGQATLVIVSDDANLVDFATRRSVIDANGLRAGSPNDLRVVTPYRSLEL